MKVSLDCHLLSHPDVTVSVTHVDELSFGPSLMQTPAAKLPRKQKVGYRTYKQEDDTQLVGDIELIFPHLTEITVPRCVSHRPLHLLTHSYFLQ